MTKAEIQECLPGAPDWLSEPECWGIVGAILTTLQWGASIHPGVRGAQLVVSVRHLGDDNAEAAMVAYVRTASEARAQQLFTELSSWLATVMLMVPSTQTIGAA